MLSVNSESTSPVRANLFFPAPPPRALSPRSIAAGGRHTGPYREEETTDSDEDEGSRHHHRRRLLPPERAALGKTGLATGGLAQDLRAAGADDDGLCVREDGGDGEAAGALDVHEERAWAGDESLWVAVAVSMCVRSQQKKGVSEWVGGGGGGDSIPSACACGPQPEG
jgi:hypothetical protein